MKRLMLVSAAALLLSAATAGAAVTARDLANDWWAQGYTAIEITQGRSQIKVEALRGTEKVEVIYDAATGAELKREVEALRAGEDIRNGVRLRQRDRDFLRLASSDDGRGGSDDGVSDDDRGDGQGRGRGRGRGRGSDDGGDDDRSGRGGSDDDRDDDRGGRDDDRGGRDDDRGGKSGRGRGRDD